MWWCIYYLEGLFFLQRAGCEWTSRGVPKRYTCLAQKPYLPSWHTRHDVVTALNQRQWRWFCVATASRAQWVWRDVRLTIYHCPRRSPNNKTPLHLRTRRAHAYNDLKRVIILNYVAKFRLGLYISRIQAIWTTGAAAIQTVTYNSNSTNAHTVLI